MSLVPISELFHFEKGTLQSSKCTPGKYNFITASSDWKTHNEYTYDCEALIFAAAASGSLGRTHYVNGKFISSDLCFILTPKNVKKYPIDLRFYHIIFNELRNDIVKNTKAGTSKEAIGLKSFGNYCLPYFDIDRQIEIKAKFSISHSYKQNLSSEQSHQLTLIKKLRQQILKDAMQGKLVPQDESDEPASELLKRIKIEKAKSNKKEKPLLEIKLEEIPFEIPENWAWCRLAYISEVGTGATPLTSNSEYYQNGSIPWITSAATGELFIEKSDHYITEKAILETNCKIYPKGTLVIAMYGQGKTRGQITELKFAAATNQACATISLYHDNLFHRRFVKSYFQKIYDEIRDLAQGGAQPNLNMQKIKNTIIPLPPLPEQQRIVSRIEELMVLCDKLEASVKANQEYTQLLYQIALKEALQPKVIDVNQEDLAIAAEPKIEYKKEEVIELPKLQEKEESHFVKRKVLATYIINQSLDDKQFGDVKFEKLLHLSDYFAIKRNLGQNYYQKVAGPLDNSFTIPFFEQIEKSKWFNRKKNGRQFQFSKAANHSKSLNTYNYFSDEELAKVQKLIDYFKKSDYEKPEIISTLYAVWNNRIIKQQPITDILIKQDFLEWDENKVKYKDRLDGALAWMRKEGVVPDGWGKVIEKPKTKKKK